jgi:hypothetical protein
MQKSRKQEEERETAVVLYCTEDGERASFFFYLDKKGNCLITGFKSQGNISIGKR